MDLWKTSGHIDFYRDSMFNQMDVDAEEYQVRLLKALGCLQGAAQSSTCLQQRLVTNVSLLFVCS